MVFISYQTYCCDCKDLGPLDSLRKISYNNSELVFIGELIDFDTIDYSYTFRIIELFKGESKTKLIKGKYFDSCSQFPSEKCKWIIYANIRENNLINISDCLASRSELHPFCNGCYDPPPPLGLNATKLEIEESEKLEKIIWDKAKNDWIEEIELLNNNKIK